ncbi:hypothetical protein F5887DRAFT_1231403 [Amanita rubescens]|nr:hypothetical protein F5887DRAFT_1231403 [Amanita rubescens]
MTEKPTVFVRVGPSIRLSLSGPRLRLMICKELKKGDEQKNAFVTIGRMAFAAVETRCCPAQPIPNNRTLPCTNIIDKHKIEHPTDNLNLKLFILVQELINGTLMATYVATVTYDFDKAVTGPLTIPQETVQHQETLNPAARMPDTTTLPTNLSALSYLSVQIFEHHNTSNGSLIFSNETEWTALLQVSEFAHIYSYQLLLLVTVLSDPGKMMLAAADGGYFHQLSQQHALQSLGSAMKEFLKRNQSDAD